MIHRDSYWSQALDAARYLGEAGMYPADVVIQCGSGLSMLVDILRTGRKRIAMDEIPHLSAAAVTGHGKDAVYGVVNNLRILVLTGRVHLYEGVNPLDAGFPAALAKAAGAKLFMVTNAAGGLNQHFATGNVMVHSDYLNLQHDSPLAHLRTDSPAERFTDPKPAYNPVASSALARHLQDSGLVVQSGVYAGVAGPAFETRAELAMIRGLGADGIGMSTIPEVMLCHFFKLPVVGLSVITNECFSRKPTIHGDVLKSSKLAAPKVSAGLQSFLEDTIWRKGTEDLS